MSLGFAGTLDAEQSVDAALPDYAKASGVSGNISSVGSDTLANLMTLWTEEFKRVYPNVNIQVQAAGSSTAPPALTAVVAKTPVSKAPETPPSPWQANTSSVSLSRVRSRAFMAT